MKFLWNTYEIAKFKFQIIICHVYIQLQTFPLVHSFFMYINELLGFYRGKSMKKEADTFHILIGFCRNHELIESQKHIDNKPTNLYSLYKIRNPIDYKCQYLGYRDDDIFLTFLTKDLVLLKTSCFLSIEYVCHDTQIFIDLSHAFFVVESEILSAEFIRWWLEYNSPIRFVFNKTYKINLMDNQLQYFSIGYGQSILLDESSQQYKIMLN